MWLVPEGSPLLPPLLNDLKAGMSSRISVKASFTSSLLIAGVSTCVHVVVDSSPSVAISDDWIGFSWFK